MNKSHLTTLRPRFLMLIALLLFSFLSDIQAAETAGKVTLVDGVVWIQGSNNKIRAIKMDQSLYNGDIIITGKDGELQARMQDEAIIAVRANTRLKIESYRAKGDEDDEAVFSLLIGTFRSITGWIGKYNRKKYAIKTTVATIGVRGTDHEPMYIPPPVPGMKPLGKPGLYDKVNSGRVVMINKFGTAEFGKNQAGFIPLGSRKAAVRLSGIPDFFKQSRNENRIKQSKKRLFKRLDKQLIISQKKLSKNRNEKGIKNKALPELLKIKSRKGGFLPDSKAQKNKRLNKKPVFKKEAPAKFNRPARPFTPAPGLKRPTTISPLNKPGITQSGATIKRPAAKPGNTKKILIPLNKSTKIKSDLQKKSVDRPVIKPLNKPVQALLKPAYIKKPYLLQPKTVLQKK